MIMRNQCIARALIKRSPQKSVACQGNRSGRSALSMLATILTKWTKQEAERNFVGLPCQTIRQILLERS